MPSRHATGPTAATRVTVVLLDASSEQGTVEVYRRPVAEREHPGAGDMDRCSARLGVSGMAKVQSAQPPASTKPRELSPKERMAIKRLTMPVQDPLLRTSNFDEVALGLSSEQAIHEAQRFTHIMIGNQNTDSALF